MLHKGRHEWLREGHRVIECDICGYRHLYPFPAAEELDAFYRENYHQEKKHISYHAVDTAFIAKQREQIQHDREHKRIFSRVSALLPAAMPLTMLDVGGGNNLLSRYFMDHGWSSLVSEPNGDAAAYLRRFQIDVVESMFERLDVRRLGTFSFISLQFVLEHVLDPLEMLCRVVKLMTPDSLLRICVPNDFSPGQLAWLAKSGLDPPWISYPDHINYFDFASLNMLLKRAGLVEVARDTTFPLEFLLLTGTDYYTNELVSKQVGPAVAGFENAWLNNGQESCLAAYYESLAGLGLGRSAIIYARRVCAEKTSGP